MKKIYVKNKDTFQAELDDELCLFNTLDAKYLSLNSSASTIWQILDEPQSLQDLKEKIKSVYQINNIDIVEKNIIDFLNQGIEKKIIDVYESTNN